MGSPQKRFAAREAILADSKLSVSARLLYQILDNMAGPKGEAFPKQGTLARMMGFDAMNGDRQIRRLLAKLQSNGYLSTRRTGRSAAVYVMIWASDRTSMSGQSSLTGQKCPLEADTNVRSSAPHLLVNQSDLTLRSTRCARCGEFHDGDAAVRCVCGIVHYPENAPAVDGMEATRAMLEGYVEQCGLSWGAPDEEICRRTLNAAGGSVRTLMQRLRHLFLDRKAKPSKSWAWFPTVVGSQSRRAG